MYSRGTQQRLRGRGYEGEDAEGDLRSRPFDPKFVDSIINLVKPTLKILRSRPFAPFPGPPFPEDLNSKNRSITSPNGTYLAEQASF